MVQPGWILPNGTISAGSSPSADSSSDQRVPSDQDPPSVLPSSCCQSSAERSGQERCRAAQPAPAESLHWHKVVGASGSLVTSSNIYMHSYVCALLWAMDEQGIAVGINPTIMSEWRLVKHLGWTRDVRIVVSLIDGSSLFGCITVKYSWMQRSIIMMS